MKLKDLKNDKYNILDFISFFDNIANTKPYFAELVFRYGERDLLSKVEDLFLDSGLGGIGMAFDLKRYEWEQLESIADELVENIMTENTTIKTIDKKDSLDKKGTNISDLTDDDYIVAYDVEENTKQSGTAKLDNTESTEKITNEEIGTDTTVKVGYDKDRIDDITNLFKNYPNYRLEIYNDIVETLCIKGYN